ncbi:hypothetical protein [Candidatus Hamiltonella endosymbiont of Tuberolachnus salignus]|uniref:hypothetical protein n=1 Tax=Candidatus Williamhamiltonella endosymbiont of Tuberolachnus salignus TaxID=3077954 RepID=UPI0030D443D8
MAHWPSLGAVIDNEKVNAFKGGFILPNLLQEMTDVLGAALTCKLGQSMGGARVYIPKKSRQTTHWPSCWEVRMPSGFVHIMPAMS